MRRKLGRPSIPKDVHVRLTRPALDTLDAWIASQPEPRPSRPEAIRRLLAKALGKAEDGHDRARRDEDTRQREPAQRAFL
jgi:hypothetical protein